ncbi:MAG: 5-(carboxyamino)imidazole ribonucleotide synthase [Bacteriovoracaceae bacterium]|nr:5-(carboxyamino)imidazole ribonucleotide synthase [Bacteroidota bacterium]
MPKKISIGILGGGQLAKMSTLAAARMGFDVTILEKEMKSPAGQLTHHEMIGWVDDELVLKSFAHHCDVVTLENEFVDHHRIEVIEQMGKKVFPSSTTIGLIQDKLLQKQTLQKNKIPVPQFIEVNDDHTFSDVSKVLGIPFVLKSRKMGYDGYGNALVSTEKEYSDAVNHLSNRHNNLMAESFVTFTMELAVMVVRTSHEIKTYPVVETIQKNHICHTVIAPAQISKAVAHRAEEIAIASVQAVKGFGIYGVEMFLSTDGSIIVNEMAPRPHNSGHYTIEACVTSQFENHLRSVLELPLGATELIQPYAVMINLLGKPFPQRRLEVYRTTLQHPNIHLHIYGKESSRLGRKMGHITILGNNLKKILKEATALEEQISL